MRVGGQDYRTIWPVDGGAAVQAIDQRRLPFDFGIATITTVSEMAAAISDMTVRGAGLIGAAAGYGMALAARSAASAMDPVPSLHAAANQLLASRPTAVNLEWAVNRQLRALEGRTGNDLLETAEEVAQAIADEDVAACAAIGQHGAPLIAAIHARTNRVVNVLTHCNAGWLAFVDHGTATAPIYEAHERGVPVHVWVDETRPRNQGARLTAWELAQFGVPHTVIADNAGGHLMQHGMVDLVITGSDRTSANGDVANKIGTYLKALAAHDNAIPFYAALPSSTIDWNLLDGVRDTPIEERDPAEVTHVDGVVDGEQRAVRIVPEGTPAANYGFDVTPARLVTGIITERGIADPNANGLRAMFDHVVPEDTP
jgi:methylthioribose-1-phosphate isomerase